MGIMGLQSLGREWINLTGTLLCLTGAEGDWLRVHAGAGDNERNLLEYL